MPFDSLTARRLISHFSERQRRILALTMTAGWQANAGIATWSATQNPECKWCNMPDTHAHQYLACPAFQSIRDQRPEAVQYLQTNPDLCFFPLSVHADEVALVRQALHLRTHTSFQNVITRVEEGTILYTDGSRDNPEEPYASRAAWAVVIKQTDDSHYQTHTFQVDTHPQKKSPWDSIQRLLQWWDANRFYVIKVKSHRQPQDATSDADCYNIWGNSFADEAAAQTRKQDLACFDHLCSNVRTHYGSQQNHVPRLWKYMLDVAYLRMLKEEDDAKDHKDPPIGLTRPNENQVNTDAHATPLEARLQTNARWTVTGDTHPLPPEPHQVVFGHVHGAST